MAGPLDDKTLNALHNSFRNDYSVNTPAQKKKQSGNALVNLLPAIGGGLGAVAGIPLDIFGGAGSIAGGAAGASLGEALKEKLSGRDLSAKQIGIQGLEGGALTAFQPFRLAKGASGVAKGFVSGGADAASTAAKNDATSTIAKNLVTQGQQAQGRVAGVSAGSKVAGKELTPQDTSTMLDTLKNEGINTGNANNALRDVQDKLSLYGKQIGDHFTNNNTPLHPGEVKTLAANYLNGLKTTDPGVLKQAEIVANDLEKNVKDTQGLWKFRVGLDSRIPDAKMAAGDNVLTNKLAAVKGMRQFIADQIGDIPGASSYHALSDVKPFISAEARRLNNPGGGIVGRIAASGPVQKGESILGKATEAIGTKAGGVAPKTLEDALAQAGPATGDISLLGATKNLAKNVGTFIPRAAAAPLAYPLKSTVQVGKQALGRGVDNVLAARNGAGQPQQPVGGQDSADLANALMQAQSGGAGDSSASQSPYSQENLMSDIQRDPKNAQKYIDYYSSLDKIYNPKASTANQIKPTGQQFGLAQGGMNSLNQLTQLLKSDPSLAAKNQTPGQGLPLVGNLITNASGAGDYHALADNVLQSLIHLQTGATATPEEVKAARGQLPGPGDSGEEVQRKLNNLATMFHPYVNGGQIGGSGGTTDANSLINALLAAQQ